MLRTSINGNFGRNPQQTVNFCDADWREAPREQLSLFETLRLPRTGILWPRPPGEPATKKNNVCKLLCETRLRRLLR